MGQQISVLLVEDDPDYGFMVERWLSHSEYADFTIEQAGSRGEALGLLAKRVFDIIISDLKLPNGSGLGILTQLRAVASETPLVVLTGREESAEDTESLLRHSDGVFYKQKMQGRETLFLGLNLIRIVLERRLMISSAKISQLEAAQAVQAVGLEAVYKRLDGLESAHSTKPGGRMKRGSRLVADFVGRIIKGIVSRG